MSNGNTQAEETAAATLQVLENFMERFDTIDEALSVVNELQKALLQLQKKSPVQQPAPRNMEAEREAMWEVVAQAAAKGAAAGIDARETSLSKSISTNVERALLGDRQDARRLGEAAETMLYKIRRWALFALGGTALTGILIGALLVTWISLVGDAGRFGRDIRNSALAELTCKIARGQTAENDNGRFCYFQLPD